MITKMNHVSVFVLNQDSAYEFYVNKLGFKVHTDAPMGPGMRWLTVCPPEQPDLEISLMPIEEGMMFKDEAAKQMNKHAIIAGIDAGNEVSLHLHRCFGFEEVAHFKEVVYKFGSWLDLKFLELRIEHG